MGSVRELGGQHRAEGGPASDEPACVGGKVVAASAAVLIAGQRGPFGHRFEDIPVGDGEAPHLHPVGGNWRYWNPWPTAVHIVTLASGAQRATCRLTRPGQRPLA